MSTYLNGIIIALLLFAQSNISPGRGNGATSSGGGSGSPPLTNLLAWYKADSLSSSPVSSWADSSGNGFTMTQTTGGNQPTWSSGQINGLPALGLNGSSQELARVGGITYSGNISIYIVWKATSVSGNAAFTSNTFNGGTGFEYRINNSGKQEALKQNTASIGTSTTTLSSGTWYETAVTYDGTSASFYLNGTADGTATSAQTITVGIDTLFSNGNTGEFFPGQVAEILIYNSSSYQTAVHTYYMGRYGI